MSLGKLNLSEGYTIPADMNAETAAGQIEAMGGGDLFMVIIRGFIALGIILAPVYIVQSFFSKEGRERLLADVIIVAALFGILRYIETRPETEPEEMVAEAPEGGEPSSSDFSLEALGGQPLPELTDKPPEWVTVVIFAGIALLIGSFIGGGVWYWHRKRKKPSSPLNQLAEEAQDAIDSIQRGGDLQTIILRSYAEMNRVVKEELGVARGTAMTARDFEQILQSKGLPGAPLRTLTRLFEQARYGAFAPGDEDEAAAITCLTEIINAVEAAVEAQA